MAQFRLEYRDMPGENGTILHPAANYGTHKNAIIRKWFAKRPRFHVHFTPTYGSWINLVERWFAELTNKRIQRGVFRSVKDLEAAIREFIDVHNSSIARYAQRTTASNL